MCACSAVRADVGCTVRKTEVKYLEPISRDLKRTGKGPDSAGGRAAQSVERAEELVGMEVRVMWGWKEGNEEGDLLFEG